MNTSSAPPGRHTAAWLDRCLVFQALDESTRQELIAYAHRHRHAPGDVIFTIGTPGQSMMVVASGIVRLSMPMRSGREIVLADLSAGEIFGELSLIDGCARSATATTVTSCEIVVLHRSNVLPILEQRADISHRLLELVCARLRRADERMADIGFSDLPARLAKLLLARSQTSKVPYRLRISQAELAAMIGSARENVNRHLRDWQRRGMVEIGKGWIQVIHPEGLAAIAQRF